MTPNPWPACPNCGHEDVAILHEATPQANVTDATLECRVCDHVFKDTIQKAQDVTLKAIVSEEDESDVTRITVPPHEPLHVGDEVYSEDHRLLVTSLEDQEDRRVDEALPQDIKTLWCKVFDTVTVDIAINQGHKTWTGEITVKPEEDFYVGDRLMIKDREVAVHAIKTPSDIHHEGSQQARDIVRLYAKSVSGEPITYKEVHRTEIHRRRRRFREGSS